LQICTTHVVLFKIWQIIFILSYRRKEKQQKHRYRHHLYWLTPSISRRRPQALYLPWPQFRHSFTILHDSRNWPTQHKWCAERESVLLMFFIFPQSGYNTRVKALHLVNVRPWAESLISMGKFVLKKKLSDRVSVLEYLFSFSNQNLVIQHM